MSCVTHRPSPVPFARVEKKGSKMRARSDSVMPRPVSLIWTETVGCNACS